MKECKNDVRALHYITISHSLMKVYIFSVSSKNLIYRGGPRCMICAITNSLEANPGQIFTTVKYSVMWHLEASSATLRMAFTVK